MNASSRPPVVLVHGAWHTARAWQTVLPLLGAAGIEAASVDLPGRGDAEAVAAAGLRDYVDAVAEVVARFDRPVALVAHSLGGVVAGQFADDQPASVAGLLYLSAFVPTAGQAVVDMVAAEEFTASETSRQQLDFEGGCSRFSIEDAAAAFYSDVSFDQLSESPPDLVPESLRVMAEPVTVRSDGLLSVRRAYVECSRDRAMPLPMQRRLQRDSRIERFATLDSDHSPFYSSSEELAAVVVRFADSLVTR